MHAITVHWCSGCRYSLYDPPWTFWTSTLPLSIHHLRCSSPPERILKKKNNSERWWLHCKGVNAGTTWSSLRRVLTRDGSFGLDPGCEVMVEMGRASSVERRQRAKMKKKVKLCPMFSFADYGAENREGYKEWESQRRQRQEWRVKFHERTLEIWINGRWQLMVNACFLPRKHRQVTLYYCYNLNITSSEIKKLAVPSCLGKHAK